MSLALIVVGGQPAREELVRPLELLGRQEWDIAKLAVEPVSEHDLFADAQRLPRRTEKRFG